MYKKVHIVVVLRERHGRISVLRILDPEKLIPDPDPGVKNIGSRIRIHNIVLNTNK